MPEAASGPVRPVFTPAGLAVFLAELHAFFETCNERVEGAVEAHFGFSTALDWITVSLELAREELTREPHAPDLTNQHP
jgi:hypothetical protein